MRNKLRGGEIREFIRKKAYLDGMRNGRGRQLPVAEILEPPLVPGEDRGLDQDDGSIRLRGSVVEFDSPAIGELEVGHPVRIDLQALIVPLGVPFLLAEAFVRRRLFTCRGLSSEERGVPHRVNRRNVRSRGSLYDKLRLAPLRPCSDRLGGGAVDLPVAKSMTMLPKALFFFGGISPGE